MLANAACQIDQRASVSGRQLTKCSSSMPIRRTHMTPGSTPPNRLPATKRSAAAAAADYENAGDRSPANSPSPPSHPRPPGRSLLANGGKRQRGAYEPAVYNNMPIGCHSVLHEAQHFLSGESSTDGHHLMLPAASGHYQNHQQVFYGSSSDPYQRNAAYGSSQGHDVVVVPPYAAHSGLGKGKADSRTFTSLNVAS